MRWTGLVAHMGEVRNSYKTLTGNCEGKKPLGRPNCRSEDNIKMDIINK
jgi:hypothetical protein